jgi:hypothetical protein
MEHVFNNSTEKLEAFMSVHVFCAPKFLSHSENAALMQFTLKTKIFIKESGMRVRATAKYFYSFYHFIRISSIVTTHKVSEAACFRLQVN